MESGKFCHWESKKYKINNFENLLKFAYVFLSNCVFFRFPLPLFFSFHSVSFSPNSVVFSLKPVFVSNQGGGAQAGGGWAGARAGERASGWTRERQ